jgi:predicted nucleic acid-binding protein
MNVLMADTSAWIDYYSGKFPELEKSLDEALLENRIAVNGIIQVELMTGARNEKEFKEFLKALKGLIWQEMSAEIFDLASRTAFAMKNAGWKIPSTDILIACSAKWSGYTLISRDQHFIPLKKQLDFSLSNYASGGASL